MLVANMLKLAKLSVFIIICYYLSLGIIHKFVTHTYIPYYELSKYRRNVPEFVARPAEHKPDAGATERSPDTGATK